MRNKSIKNLERANKLYMIDNGKRHIMLATLYYDSGLKHKAIENAMIAKEINPNYKNVKELLEILSK